jgi:hypothetical protein
MPSSGAYGLARPPREVRRHRRQLTALSSEARATGNYSPALYSTIMGTIPHSALRHCGTYHRERMAQAYGGRLLSRRRDSAKTHSCLRQLFLRLLGSRFHGRHQVFPLRAHRVTVPPPLPSRTPPRRLTHHPGIELSKCQASSTSRRRLVNLCPWALTKRRHLLHPISPLRRMLTRRSLLPWSTLTPPPAYRFRLIHRMESMWHSCSTTCLRPMQCTHNGLFDNSFFFSFFFHFLLCFIFCLHWRLPVILPTAPTVRYGIRAMPPCFPHELHSVHTMFLFGCFVRSCAIHTCIRDLCARSGVGITTCLAFVYIHYTLSIERVDTDVIASERMAIDGKRLLKQGQP